MNALVPFTQTVADASTRIENAQAIASEIRQALASGCGLLEGYYRAGGVCKVEYEGGCVYLRRVAHQRLSLLELRDAAIEAGLDQS
jgi:hypothetical protein